MFWPKWIQSTIWKSLFLWGFQTITVYTFCPVHAVWSKNAPFCFACLSAVLSIYPCVTTQNCWTGFCAVWYYGFLLLRFQLKLDTINEHFVWRPKYASTCFSGALPLYGNYLTADKYFKWSCLENNKFYAQSTSLCFSK
jgi:hypothetical protein